MESEGRNDLASSQLTDWSTLCTDEVSVKRESRPHTVSAVPDIRRHKGKTEATATEKIRKKPMG